MATKSINEVIDSWYAKFEAFPADLHMLCPKVDDDDQEDYTKLDDGFSSMTRSDKERRIQDGIERRRTTLWNSILFALEASRTQEKLEAYSLRLEHALTSCDKCIMNWHMGQTPFLREVQESATSYHPVPVFLSLDTDPLFKT
jgi:senataxin